jgi:hypothetical protein
LRLFSAERGAPRSRRPADALLLALSVLFLALIGWVSNPQSGFDRRVAVFLVLVPAVLNLLWPVGMGILSFWALFLLAASLVRVRLDVLRDYVLALLGSVVAVLLTHRVVGWRAPSLWSSALVARAAS